MQSQEFLTPLVETLRAQIGAEAVVSFFPSHGQASRRALMSSVGDAKSRLSSASRGFFGGDDCPGAARSRGHDRWAKGQSPS